MRKRTQFPGQFRQHASVIGTLVIAVAVPAVAGDDSPPFRFEQCMNCGLEPYDMAFGMGAGVAAADYDNDGDIDLFVPNAPGTRDQLYRNNGDGTFVEVGMAAGVGSLEENRNALWFDADGDDDLDLLVANDDPNRPSTYTFYRQAEDHTFSDATVEADLFIPLPEPIEPGTPHRGGLTAGDLNNDGWLDIVSCLWNGYPQILFNDGDGTFTDVTETTGITTPVAYSHQAVIFDVDHDGWQDIYTAVDYRWNTLYINQGDGTFIDVAEDAHCDNAWNDMGIGLGDFDRDGDFDLYVTNITAPGVHNILLRNDSTEQALLFTEISQSLEVNEGGWGWGNTFIDADNDGWLDIAATNGWISESYINDPSRFFWNRSTESESPVFVDAADTTQFNDTDWGSCLIAADLNRDGALDLVQTCREGPFRIYRNEPVNKGHGHWLTVRPRWQSPNHHAIGARIEVVADGITHQRLITAGISYLGQEPAEAHVGIGEATSIETIRIHWPDGSTTCVHDVAADQTLTITPADGADISPADLDENGAVDVNDLLLLLSLWGPCPTSCDDAPCPGDISGPAQASDCTVDLFDLMRLLDQWGC